MTTVNFNRLDGFADVMATCIRNGAWQVSECRLPLQERINAEGVACVVDHLIFDHARDRIVAYLSGFEVPDADVDELCSALQARTGRTIFFEPRT